MQKFILAVFKPLNHQMTLACNGEEALRFVDSEDFDLVLMDIRMPVMDGLEATKQIRALNGPKFQIPIIALTADLEAGNIQEYNNVGVNSVCAKPIDLPSLLKKIDEILDEEIHLCKRQEEDPAQHEEPLFVSEERFSTFLAQVANIVDQLSDLSRNEFSESLMLSGVPTEEISEMVQSYEKGLRKTCSELCVSFEDFSKCPEDGPQRKKLSQKAQDLKGAGSIYGYHLVSSIAAMVEDIFKKKPHLDLIDLRNIGHHFEALSLVAEKKLTGSGGELGRLVLKGLRDFSEKE